MKKYLMLAFVLISALVVGSTAPLSAQQRPPEGGTPKAFTLPKKETFTLKNGMRVTLVPYGTIPKVTISAAVRAGNLN
ncbi:MAG TPA: hypothetical protein VM095_17455, partial [Pyrinomonadaceae bacterium]|nr:hypothetical protein [Pyrinomonadaceae bacterium]